ncbi:hypothetical protein IPN35_01090 [Candidatus Peregrinibacteria bacterium]|nr:MAG: hypothetical protein IPN35_01090 [Candidatus Peregrinibacteria bacterium]
MQEQFIKFGENIRLTSSQREDAKKKYNGVCKKLHDYFYDTEYDGNTKFLFGSYKKNTAIRPFTDDQDVDVLFKMPEDDFAKFDNQDNGQSALLSLVRKVLMDSKYALGDKPKAWGKVILIKTSDGTHNIELLPAFEQDDKTFLIPNTENGGEWETFDPRSELKRFNDSNSESNRLTAELSRMIKRWKQEVSSLSIKSFEIEDFVIDFLEGYEDVDSPYSQVVKDFFEYLHDCVDGNNKSFVQTAKDRATKAIEYEENEKFEKATEEWRKVFGDSFPSYSTSKSAFAGLLALGDYSHCEPLRWNEQRSHRVSIDAYLYRPDKKTKSGGVNSDGRTLPNQLWWIKFVANTNARGDFQYYWQVVNTGEHARSSDGLRGDIFQGYQVRWEQTQYTGKHWIECYVVQNGACIARSGKFLVNIM